MTKEQVKNILEREQNYPMLFNEFHGQFHCDYFVRGVHFRLFNEGGRPKILILSPIPMEVNSEEIVEFVRYAYDINNGEVANSTTEYIAACTQEPLLKCNN